MKQSTKGALLALALLATAGSAHAAVSVSSSAIDTPLPTGFHLVYDFDGLVGSGYSMTINSPAGVYDGSAGLISGIAAPPPGTTSNYLSVLGGGSAVLNTPLITALSIYMGSPDDYNTIQFIGPGGFNQTLTGAALSDGSFGGNQSIGRRLVYDFGGAKVNQVIFGSTGNSFELDNIAASGVPEPTTWAMLILGFAGIGAALRKSRRQTATQATIA